MPFPMLVAKAKGARLTDIDGHSLDDFCLGDTGSMFGHSPAPLAASAAQLGAACRQGLTQLYSRLRVLQSLGPDVACLRHPSPQ